MPDATSLFDTAKQYLYPNYRQPDLLFTHGEGCRLFDSSGKSYLDFYAGIAVSTLGHNHLELVNAISTQAAKVLHLSNYFYNEPNIKLAAAVCKLSGMQRAFFANSGAEAMEAMLKLARRHYFAQGQLDRHRIIAFDKSFHGRTLGALAVTGQPKYREGFGPLSTVTHVAYGDVDAVRGALGQDVAAILVEPVQGEGGIVPAPEGFLKNLRSVADEAGCLLLADEIQTGVGRTGTFLAFQGAGVRPDAVTLAKGLAGGVPIGAMLTSEELAGSLPPGTHGTTFGGSPLASAAALAVLNVLERDALMKRAQSLGSYLGDALDSLVTKHPKVALEARGLGLMRAVELAAHVEARPLLSQLRDAGVLLTVAGGTALRFTPPLTISQAEIDECVAIVDGVLGTL